MRLSLSVLVTILVTQIGCQTSLQKTKYDRASLQNPIPVDGGFYIEPSIADATVFNPMLATDSASNDINSVVYNGLVKYDKDIQLVGELAKNWEIKNDGKTFIFHLRENVKWHDGKPFTSEDVLFTYKKLISPDTKTPFSGDYKLVKSAAAPDPFTFIVHYNEPFAPALESWGMGIIPKHIYQEGDINTHPANRNPIGTGPYIFKSWKTDEQIELVPNPEYFEGKPHFERYIYRIIPDLSVQFLELRQGTWSIMNPSPDQYNGYDEFFVDYDKYNYPAFRYDYIALNLKNPLFTDIRVRKALSHAINKQLIIDSVYQGLAVPSTGPFPPTSWAWNPDVKGFDFDLEKSKLLLEEAGWRLEDKNGIRVKNGKPFKFTLITNQGNTVRESIAQILKHSFQQIGVDMEIRIIEWSVFIQKYISPREFEATLLAWNLARDPDAFSIWHSGQIGENQYNMNYYSNPVVDRLIIDGRKTFDETKRQKIYQEIHARIAADVPYLFLVTPMSLPVVHKSIMNVQLEPAGLGWNFKDWYIPQKWQQTGWAAE